MRVLIIGSGGREHTLAWKIKQSPKVTKIFVAPGNAGTAELAENVELQVTDIEGLKKFAKENKIDLTVVGPEVPLVAGIVDEFEKENLKVFGPSKQAAMLEGSKIYAKKMMKKFKVPTAKFEIFKDPQKALEHIYMSKFPVVIKADGLAAGKGVVVAKSLVEAIKAIDTIMKDKIFGEAGEQVIIEECLVGEEASILAFVDGKNFISMTSAQDHKPIYDNDEGPNTGGMGTYSPAPVVTPAISQDVEEKVFKPMIRGMAEEGVPFKGILYAGLMITSAGPSVIEFNCRFGDPETQVVLPRLKNDLVEVMEACIAGSLDRINLEWHDNAAVCVVLAADGYPGKYNKGDEITGLKEAAELPETVVFHAGTKLSEQKVVTSGGRVLGVTAMGEDIKTAIKNTYKAVEIVDFKGKYNRSDIGKKALKK